MTLSENRSTHYEHVIAVIQYMLEHSDASLDITDVASALDLDGVQLQGILDHWLGVPSVRSLSVGRSIDLPILSPQRGKQLLAASASRSEVAHAQCVSVRRPVSLTVMRRDQRTLMKMNDTLYYGESTSVFGEAFIAWADRGIFQLIFLAQDISKEQGYVDAQKALQQQWPCASLQEDSMTAKALIAHVFCREQYPVSLPDNPLSEELFSESPLSLFVMGTPFQTQVWQALLSIPVATVTSYREIAQTIGRPKAMRAVGSAIGANPIAFLIPCHRVIQQSGCLGGYRWGEVRKHAMYAWEAYEGQRMTSS
jgi:AraC family transcriptional regulator of adaptative response/methylated-DNA-[protein]-cysteine methyltransferase